MRLYKSQILVDILLSFAYSLVKSQFPSYPGISLPALEFKPYFRPGGKSSETALPSHTRGNSFIAILPCLSKGFFFIADIDECKIDGVKCTQICNNKDGGYDCQCYDGFTLGADGFTCTGK